MKALVMAAVLLATAGAVAKAQDDSDDDANRSYWSIAFSGGVLQPIGDSADSRQSGLVAAAHLGWTSRIGLGAYAGVDYSPLPRVKPEGVQSIDSHLVAAVAAPRFTLGRETFRAWVAAGGGGVLERTSSKDSAGTSSTDTAIEPAASAAAGLEMHFSSNAGLTLAASGLQSFGDNKLRAYELTGGLVFVFR